MGVFRMKYFKYIIVIYIGFILFSLLYLTIIRDEPDTCFANTEEISMLPVKNPKWVSQHGLFALELQHGWIVKFDKGMTFVPKP
jgi:hypothetical protein